MFFRFSFLVFVLALGLLSACSNTKPEKPDVEKPVAELYNGGLNSLRKGASD